MWYRTGTVAVTNASTTVTGTGTNWIAGVGVGEAFYGPDGRLYEIASIVSATQLTLGSAYLGTSQSGQTYQIVPSQSYIRDLAAQAAQLVADYAGFASNAGSGKFTDGDATTPGIRFTSDENTGIRRAAADDMRLVAGGADQATVNTTGLVVRDDKLRITGSADATKVAVFEVDGFTAATTRTMTLPNASTTVVGTDATQTLTNKTINLTSNTLVATSAQLASAVTDETGSGSLVFGTAPTLTNPVVTGGTINNTVIGGTTRAAGSFTTLNANGNVVLGDANTDVHTVFGTLNQAVGAGVGISTGGNLTVRSPDGAEGGQLTLNNRANTAGTLNIDVDPNDQCRIFTTQNNTNISIGQLGGATGGAISFLTESTERLNISSAGTTTITGNAVVSSSSSSDALRITQTGTGNALLVEDSANPDSTPFVIDQSGNVFKGHTASISTPFALGFQINGTAGDSGMSLTRWTASAANPTLTLAKSRGAAVATRGIVANGDNIGDISFVGDDGANFVFGAQITAAVDGTPGTNDMPGRLVFSTTADGASTPTERMRINSSGNVSIGTTGGDFSRTWRMVARQDQNATTQIGVINATVGATAVAQITKIGGTANSFVDWSLSDANGAPFDTCAYGSAVQYALWSFGGSERMRLTSSGSLGIGGAPAAQYDLQVLSSITGSAFSAQIVASGQVQSDVTSRADYFLAATTCAAGTYARINGYQAQQSTFTGTVTNQMGFSADASLVGATNNFGFYSDIPAATGRWNFYANGTADNFFAGNVGLNITPTCRLDVSGTTRFVQNFGGSGVANIRLSAAGTAQSQEAGISFYPTFEGSADNAPRRAADIWAGYNGGTWGNEYLAFGVGVGAGGNDALNATTERMRIDGSGNVLLTNSTGGLGYGTGAGGTVTQATSKSTAVTLNRPTGQITMNGAALAAGASVEFTVNNTVCNSVDTVLVSKTWDAVPNTNYRVECSGAGVAAFAIRVTNITAGSLSEAVKINFAIIKGATS